MALLKKSKQPEVMPPDLQNAEARLQQSDLVNPGPPRKKSVSPVLLGAAALGLTGLALGSWYLLGAKQAPPEDTALIPAPRRADAPPVSTAPTTAAKPGTTARPGATAKAGTKAGTKAGPRPTTKPGAATRPGARSGDPKRPGGVQQRQQLAALRDAAAKQPGRLGITPPGTDPRVPAIAPSTPGQPPRMAPVLGSPTPMQPPDFAEGIPGRRGGRNEVVLAPRAPVASPAQLKELWKQGAAAKDRGDKAAALRAWSEILRLSPGHPGIQEAIAKLG